MSDNFAGPIELRALPARDGLFLVTTSSGTTYEFDLKRLTVTRTPGPASQPDIHDGVRRLRSIDSCEVGRAGYWTMRSDDPSVDFYWQLSSPVVRIVELSRPSVDGPAEDS
ncbi:hypothetical protein ACFQ9V_13255 [Leifsonia sp. NPDC056665]|uniref:hypothetical protein n=1 Tax=Leifsonia sp. NPDC056665 TaxID=3345901 RepID=UPI00367D45FC